MKSDDKTRMEYILVGIICVLVIGFLVTLIVMIANIYRQVLCCVLVYNECLFYTKTT